MSKPGALLVSANEKWHFTPDSERAHVFDYHADEVEVQLEQARRNLGVIWVAVPVDPRDVGETCDACGRAMICSEACFDGSRYLCPACYSGA